MLMLHLELPFPGVDNGAEGEAAQDHLSFVATPKNYATCCICSFLLVTNKYHMQWFKMKVF